MLESISEENKMKIANAKDNQALLSTIMEYCDTAAEVVGNAASHLRSLLGDISEIEEDMVDVSETASSASFEEYLDVLGRSNQALLDASADVNSRVSSGAYRHTSERSADK